jgi:hypothetical protein
MEEEIYKVDSVKTIKSKYGIPKLELESLINVHRKCAYCSTTMIFPYDTNNRRESATIEHLNWEGPFYWSDNLSIHDIVIVCHSCNSSRGVKDLKKWFKSNYCIKKDINIDTVHKRVVDYINRKYNLEVYIKN